MDKPDRRLVVEHTQVVAQVLEFQIRAQFERLRGSACWRCGQKAVADHSSAGQGDQYPADGGDVQHDLLCAGGARVGQQALEQDREHKGSEQDSGNGNGLHNPVGLGKVAAAHQLLDVAVLRRAVDGTLYCQREGQGEGRPEPALVVSRK